MKICGGKEDPGQTRLASARADSERICVLMKALFRRNTLCISRKSDEIRAQIIRKMPMATQASLAPKIKKREIKLPTEKIPEKPLDFYCIKGVK